MRTNPDRKPIPDLTARQHYSHILHGRSPTTDEAQVERFAASAFLIGFYFPIFKECIKSNPIEKVTLDENFFETFARKMVASIKQNFYPIYSNALQEIMEKDESELNKDEKEVMKFIHNILSIDETDKNPGLIVFGDDLFIVYPKIIELMFYLFEKNKNRKPNKIEMRNMVTSPSVKMFLAYFMSMGRGYTFPILNYLTTDGKEAHSFESKFKAVFFEISDQGHLVYDQVKTKITPIIVRILQERTDTTTNDYRNFSCPALYNPEVFDSFVKLMQEQIILQLDL